MEVQFDPGFIQHLSAFIPSIQHVYGSLAQYKNFNQKKMQFRMYYPKIQSIIKTYIGFYLGCMLWALCIKQYKNADILNNLMFGGEYSEEETLSEVDFFRQYLEQFRKDAKYYLGIDLSTDENYIKITDAYREFLKINKGFVNTKTTDDIKIPEILKQPSDMDLISKEVDRVVENGQLSELIPLADMVL